MLCRNLQKAHGALGLQAAAGAVTHSLCLPKLLDLHSIQPVHEERESQAGEQALPHLEDLLTHLHLPVGPAAEPAGSAIQA